MSRIIICLFVIYLAVFNNVFALQFSEIQYDPAGSDTKREWIEVYNDTDEIVDLSEFGLLENQINHGINHFSGAVELSPGQYAVIAADADTISKEYSATFSLFDSVFTLNNTGEEIKLLDADDDEIARASYSSDFGANNDGNSLNYISGSWIVRKPSPGSEVNSEVITESGSSTQSSARKNTLVPVKSEKPSTDFKILIPKIVVSNQNQVFKLESETRYYVLWRFSDGEVLTGKSITRLFELPGKYSVTAEVKKDGKEVASETVQIEVESPNLKLTTGLHLNQRYLRITNLNGANIDLSNWKVIIGNKLINFPAKIILSPNDDYAFRISNELTYPIIITNSTNQAIVKILKPSNKDVLITKADIKNEVSNTATTGNSLAISSEESIDEDEIIKAEEQAELRRRFNSYGDIASQPTEEKPITNDSDIDQLNLTASPQNANLYRDDSFSSTRIIINTIFVLLLGAGLTLLVSSKRLAIPEEVTTVKKEDDLALDYEILTTDENDF